MAFTIAIIGRPNVGKSTLFNRLVGRKLALVDDQPGVTRDRRMGEGSLGELSFDLIDTAGLEDSDDDTLEGRMRAQTDLAIEEADLCLFLIDARAGVTPLDSYFAGLLRKSDKPVLLLANKCEGKVGETGLYEAYELGLGDPIAISAEHGHGLGNLQDEILPFSDAYDAAAQREGESEDGEQPLRVAVVGRPNAGKSTLINRMIGEDRMLTGPEAGITRDSISVEWDWTSKDGDRARRLKLFDTAGMRKKARVTGKIEKLSVADGLRAVRFAEIVVVLIDALVPLEKQDLHIVDLIAKEGRGVVIAVNKWDLVEDRQEVLKELRLRVEELLPQIRGVPFITLSALTGRGIDHLVPAILDAEQGWNARIGTGELNRWLEAMQERHPPPAAAGRRVRLRYMTQAKSRPPTFAIFSSRADAVPESYIRYLINGLRETFGLQGVPIRLNLRKGKNPYADRKPKAKTKKGQATK